MAEHADADRADIVPPRPTGWASRPARGRGASGSWASTWHGAWR